MQLASRFASHSPALRSDHPLSDDQIRRVAPSIFADAPHESRSERYSYIPTAAVLTELRKEHHQELRPDLHGGRDRADADRAGQCINVVPPDRVLLDRRSAVSGADTGHIAHRPLAGNAHAQCLGAVRV